MNKQLEALIAEIKKQTENFDTVVLKIEETEALIAALEQSQQQNKELIDERTESTNEMARIIRREIKLRRAAEKRIAELETERHSTVTKVDIADAEKVAAEIREYNAREIRPLPVLSDSPLAVKLPDELIDEVCLVAAEIHNRGNGVDDDKAQFIIERIRNFLENGGQVEGE